MSRIAQSYTSTAAGWTALLGGVAVAAFWALYFTTDLPLGHGEPVARAFESAFLVADAAFGIALFASGWALLRNHPVGPFLLVVAASVSLYLGLLDVTFYAVQGFYWPFSGSVGFELAVNAACIGGGAVGLRFGWLLWRGRTRAGRSDRRVARR